MRRGESAEVDRNGLRGDGSDGKNLLIADLNDAGIRERADGRAGTEQGDREGLTGADGAKAAAQNLAANSTGDGARTRTGISGTDGPGDVGAGRQNIGQGSARNGATGAVGDVDGERDWAASSDGSRSRGGDGEVTDVGRRESDDDVVELLGARGDGGIDLFVRVVAGSDVEFELAEDGRNGSDRWIADEHGSAAVGAERRGIRNSVIGVVIDAWGAAGVGSRRNELIVVPGNGPVDGANIVVGVGFNAGSAGVDEVVYAVAVGIGIAERNDPVAIGKRLIGEEGSEAAVEVCRWGGAVGTETIGDGGRKFGGLDGEGKGNQDLRNGESQSVSVGIEARVGWSWIGIGRAVVGGHASGICGRSEIERDHLWRRSKGSSHGLCGI